MESLFTLIVWVTIVVTAPTSRAGWVNLFISTALSAAAWAVAESFIRERESPDDKTAYLPKATAETTRAAY